MAQRALTEAELDQFTGTEQWYRHGFARNVLYTDGVKYMAEKGGAYWLIDAIVSHQINPKVRKNERLQEFQVWTLKVAEDRSAVLTCQADSGEKAIVTQKIEATDFPLKEIKLWVEPTGGPNGEILKVILLPSEH